VHHLAGILEPTQRQLRTHTHTHHAMDSDTQPTTMAQQTLTGSFDIVATYQSLLKSDPDLTMPVAAIESLVRALAEHPTSTISETLEYLKTQTAALIASTANPISLSAGTDLFQRYLITSLQQRGTAGNDFESVRTHLLKNGRLFVARAKDSRKTIAGFGRSFVRDGCTVLTAGGSRVVGALLREAAASVRFKVIYVLSPTTPASGSASGPATVPEGTAIVQCLREKGVPVATISDGAVGYSMNLVDMVIVGAEGIVENGGAISRLGTYQLGLLAKAVGKPMYVVAESHKFVRLFPLGQYDLPIKQNVIEFQVDDGKRVDPNPKMPIEDEGVSMEEETSQATGVSNGPKDAVDFTVSCLPPPTSPQPRCNPSHL
jgi:translation initiation factor eIF-2B subunit alpha